MFALMCGILCSAKLKPRWSLQVDGTCSKQVVLGDIGYKAILVPFDQE